MSDLFMASSKLLVNKWTCFVIYLHVGCKGNLELIVYVSSLNKNDFKFVVMILEYNLCLNKVHLCDLIFTKAMFSADFWTNKRIE